MSPAGQVGHTSYPSRISVPRRGFCFLGKTRPGNSCASRISFPSRGFCFLGKHDLGGWDSDADVVDWGGCPEILVLEPISARQHIWPPGWQFGPRSANNFFPRPCRRLDRWDTSYPSRISVPSRGFCFLGKHHLEKVVRLGSAFLAGAFDFWEKHEPWLLLPCYSMTMETAKLLRAPRHAPGRQGMTRGT